MKVLSIDIETYSSKDIQDCGLYNYVQASDFEILLFAYSFDDEDVKIIDLAQGEQLPNEIVSALSDKSIVKSAYNAAFEWYCLNKFWKSPIDQWQCTMVKGLYCGYPAGLAAIGNALGLAEDKKKLATGKALIRYFCMPCRATKTNGGRTRNLPKHDLDRWNLFKEYCKQDVVTEKEVKKVLNNVEFPQSEQEMWIIDQLMNAYGVEIDKKLVDGALYIDEVRTEELIAEAIEISNLNNPKSVSQLKEWITKQTGQEINSLNKSEVPALIENTDSEKVKRMLEIRQELSKTSTKKYVAMNNVACDDLRVKGLLQFYGANRTGRWAGRLVQVQNLPRNYIKTLDLARELVKNQNIDALKLIYGNVPDTLSQLIRTAFIAPIGKEFVIADFSAIEARVISWLAGEQWRLEVFKTHGKIYEASASQMFGVPIEKIKKGNPEYALRQKGKVAELALGYQGSSGALIQMGALDMGLSEEELPEIVERWRSANRRIVDLWHTIQTCAIKAVSTGTPQAMQKGIVFNIENSNLVVTLPSKRKLFYIKPELSANQFESESITYMGQNQTTKKWIKIPTYGGKLTENIIQAIARDCLAVAIKNLVAEGYIPVFHIHDEVICEVPKDDKYYTLERAVEIMCRPISWADGLPLNADGFKSKYYKKE